MDIIEGAVEEWKAAEGEYAGGGDDIDDEIFGHRLYAITSRRPTQISGGDDSSPPGELPPDRTAIILNEIDSFDDDGGGAILVIGGRDQRSASTAEPGLRRLFRIMQHVRPTFSDQQRKKALEEKRAALRKKLRKKNLAGKKSKAGADKKTKKKKKGSAEPGESAAESLFDFVDGGDDSDEPADDYESADESADESGDESNDSGDESDESTGDESSKDRRKLPARLARKPVKIRQADLYKYTDSVTDEPVDDYVNDFNVAVEVDKMGFRGILTHAEKQKIDKRRKPAKNL